MRRLIGSLIALAFVLGLSGGIVEAKQCRDAKGKFTKCKTTNMPAKKPCRDKKGRFIKCKTM